MRQGDYLEKVIHMDGTRKTAVLLLSLDQAVAAALLRKLPRDQVERVTLAIANAENVARDEQEQVLTEFKSAFVSRPLMQPVGPETARELLEDRSINPKSNRCKFESMNKLKRERLRFSITDTRMIFAD